MVTARLLPLSLLLAAACLAGTLPISHISLTGTIAPTVSDVSNMQLLYLESDGISTFQTSTFLNTSCAAGNSCAISASIDLTTNPSFVATSAFYTILGFYAGGPGLGDVNTVHPFPGLTITTVVQNPKVFIVTDPAFNGNAGDFQTLYGSAFSPIFNIENFLSTDLYNHQAINIGPSFLTSNLDKVPAVALGGAAATGTVYDYSNGVSNGTVTLEATTATPEPAGTSLAGGLLVALAVRVRGLRAARLRAA